MEINKKDSSPYWSCSCKRHTFSGNVASCLSLLRSASRCEGVYKLYCPNCTESYCTSSVILSFLRKSRKQNEKRYHYHLNVYIIWIFIHISGQACFVASRLNSWVSEGVELGTLRFRVDVITHYTTHHHWVFKLFYTGISIDFFLVFWSPSLRHAFASIGSVIRRCWSAFENSLYFRFLINHHILRLLVVHGLTTCSRIWSHRVKCSFEISNEESNNYSRSFILIKLLHNAQVTALRELLHCKKKLRMCSMWLTLTLMNKADESLRNPEKCSSPKTVSLQL